MTSSVAPRRPYALSTWRRIQMNSRERARRRPAAGDTTLEGDGRVLPGRASTRAQFGRRMASCAARPGVHRSVAVYCDSWKTHR